MQAETFKDGIHKSQSARTMDSLHRKLMKAFRKRKIESALVISDYGATTELFCSADITIAGRIRVCYIDENGEDKAQEFSSRLKMAGFVGEKIKMGEFPSVSVVYNHMGDGEDSLSIFALKGGEVEMYEISSANPIRKSLRM